MSTLFLGKYDTGKIRSNEDRKAYLRTFHTGGNLTELTENMLFNDDDASKKREFVEVPGTEVSQLQQFLFEKGFMPRGVIDGVFDYVTQAAVRLFQEYVRSIEGVQDMKVDGVVGEGTLEHVKRWQENGIYCDWAQWSKDKPTAEYTAWMALLGKAKKDYMADPHPILKQVAKFTEETDTIKINDWKFEPDDIHLIGIRVDQDLEDPDRENDDLFVLLIKGLVFKFWGSTDPSQKQAYYKKEVDGQKIKIKRPDEAFLVEGQHKYKYGWHHSTYRALKPYKHGVLVFRDRDDNDALTEADIRTGLDPSPNTTINIHWSGIGLSNWSAGCQVIAGQSYINHNNDPIQCIDYKDQKRKGAYNMLADLIVCYATKDRDYIYYTLGRDGSLDLDSFFGKGNYVATTIQEMAPKTS